MHRPIRILFYFFPPPPFFLIQFPPKCNPIIYELGSSKAENLISIGEAVTGLVLLTGIASGYKVVSRHPSLFIQW